MEKLESTQKCNIHLNVAHTTSVSHRGCTTNVIVIGRRIKTWVCRFRVTGNRKPSTYSSSNATYMRYICHISQTFVNKIFCSKLVTVFTCVLLKLV